MGTVVAWLAACAGRCPTTAFGKAFDRARGVAPGHYRTALCRPR